MTSREEMPNLPPKKRHYQEAPGPQTTIYKNIPLMLSNTKQSSNENIVPVHRTDRPVLVLDSQGMVRQHSGNVHHGQNGQRINSMSTVTTSQGNGGDGKISQVVYTSGPSFGTHQTQYAYANGFINTVQGPMTQILPAANLSQGQTYQTVMATNEPMQPQLLLSKPLLKTQAQNSNFPKTIPKSAIHIAENGKSRNLQLGTIKVTNSNSSFRAAPVQYRKITSQNSFPRPGKHT